MDLRQVTFTNTIAIEQLIRLAIAKIGYIFLFALILYSLAQTFFISNWPGYYDIIRWYASIDTSNKISFALLFVTVLGFMVTFNILEQNRKSEAYTKAIISASEELHQTTQGILSIFNKYDFYFKKILDVNNQILQKNSTSRDIAFAIEYLSGQKEMLSRESDELGKLINSLYSASAKNSYIFLLENVSVQHERLTSIASHIHLQCINVNIIYNKTNPYDFSLFSSQVDSHKITKCAQLINLGRDCIAKLSGYINGKFVSHIAPTRVTTSFYVIKNRHILAKSVISTNDMCIVDKIDKAASDIASAITNKQACAQSAFQEIEAPK